MELWSGYAHGVRSDGAEIVAVCAIIAVRG